MAQKLNEVNLYFFPLKMKKKSAPNADTSNLIMTVQDHGVGKKIKQNKNNNQTKNIRTERTNVFYHPWEVYFSGKRVTAMHFNRITINNNNTGKKTSSCYSPYQMRLEYVDSIPFVRCKTQLKSGVLSIPFQRVRPN